MLAMLDDVVCAAVMACETLSFSQCWCELDRGSGGGGGGTETGSSCCWRLRHRCGWRAARDMSLVVYNDVRV
jgi:hypothetical protein